MSRLKTLAQLCSHSSVVSARGSRFLRSQKTCVTQKVDYNTLNGRMAFEGPRGSRSFRSEKVCTAQLLTSCLCQPSRWQHVARLLGQSLGTVMHRAERSKALCSTL